MEVKFRGKRLDNGEWVWGEKLTVGDKVIIVPFGAVISFNAEHNVKDGVRYGFGEVAHGESDSPWPAEVHPDSVGMWTGKSKWEEGKRVLDYYENDIIEVMIYDLRRKNFVVEETGPLVWNSNGFYCKGDSGKWQRPNFDNIRVIGNATDNPELLK